MDTNVTIPVKHIQNGDAIIRLYNFGDVVASRFYSPTASIAWVKLVMDNLIKQFAGYRVLQRGSVLLVMTDKVIANYCNYSLDKFSNIADNKVSIAIAHLGEKGIPLLEIGPMFVESTVESDWKEEYLYEEVFLSRDTSPHEYPPHFPVNTYSINPTLNYFAPHISKKMGDEMDLTNPRDNSLHIWFYRDHYLTIMSNVLSGGDAMDTMVEHVVKSAIIGRYPSVKPVVKIHSRESDKPTHFVEFI